MWLSVSAGATDELDGYMWIETTRKCRHSNSRLQPSATYPDPLGPRVEPILGVSGAGLPVSKVPDTRFTKMNIDS